MVSLPRAKAADELDKRCGVRMSHTAVDIHTNFIHTVDKLQVESVQKFFFRNSFLDNDKNTRTQ